MKHRHFHPGGAFLLLFLGCVVCLVSSQPLHAAATLTQSIDPAEVNVGDQVNINFVVQGESDFNIQLPPIDGLQVLSNSLSSSTMVTLNGFSSQVTQTFAVVPERAGDFTIPAFEIRMGDGQVLHARAMKLHVLNGGAVSPGNSPAPPGNGPVVMPPGLAGQAPPPEADSSSETLPGTDIKPPMESDGRPAKVFMVLTAKTTDAYVGETIPLRIEFYIRMDSIAQQDSLPTIQGSDFLMNDLSVRPLEDEVAIVNEPFHRETWVTAISAPRSGDFPLQMLRDTYWNKNSQLFSDPIGNFFAGRSNLAHANIPSNKLVIHAHSLPQEGRPADFTGAIGQFKVAGSANPTTVNVGDPAYLDFNISGEGNFDSVRCPVLAPDADWKSYSASSQIHYVDESHIQGEKTFHQAIIPKKNGILSLPAASFSYFDPTLKEYVTIPIPLPAMTVTGSPLPAAPAASSAAPGNPTMAVNPPAASGFAPNRVEFGKLRAALMPAYRQGWFWIPQVGLLILAILAALGFFLYSRAGEDSARAEHHLRQRSLTELEAAMSSAAQGGDAPAFFLSARRAVQLRWGAGWNLPPDAVTLAEIAARDPQLAEAATPLFQQADEVMYSGHAASGLDLVEWERHVREELLQPQPA